MEAAAHVPTPKNVHSDNMMDAAMVEDERVVVDETWSKAELFDNLVARSPTAEIDIGGVFGCVFDTGAETSLITSSFFFSSISPAW